MRETLDLIQTYSAPTEAAVYGDEGMSIRTFRAQHQESDKYKRKLAGVTMLVESVMSGRRPMYELKEVLEGKRHLSAFQETLTTGDFTNLFGDVIDRQLMAQYASTPSDWRQYCRVAAVNDFKTVKRFPLDGLRAPMDIVPESDNYPSGRVTDASYSYAVQKRGRTVPMAWEAIVNDDLDAFSRFPMLLSDAAINSEEQFVSQLLVNSSGFLTAFFNNTNKNIVNIANGAVSNNPVLNAAALQDGLTVLMQQTDGDGAPIAVRGVTLVVPPSLAITAQALITTIQTLRIGAGGGTDGATQVAYSMPEWLKNLKFAVSYYLPLVNTTSGKTTWFLFADPRTGRQAIEIGFLRSHEAPELFRKLPNAQRLGGGVDPLDGSFENDSVGYKMRHTFGGTTMDPKGVVVSRGDGAS